MTFDPSRLAVDALVAAVESAGYSAALPRATGDATQVADADSALRVVRLRLLVSVLLTVPLALLAMVPPLQFAG